MKKLFLLALLGASLSCVACGSNNENEDDMNFEPMAMDFNSHKAALKKADSCDDYRAHLLDAAARDIANARFGWNYRYYANGVDYAENAGADNGGSANEPKNEAGEFTVTNIQEEGVDEIDTVKNDGQWMYHIPDGDEVVITRAWPAENLEVVARINPASNQDDNDWWYTRGMLLDGNNLIIIGTNYRFEGETMVKVYDVSDPTNPKFVKSHAMSGWLEDGRLINHRLHLVLSSWSHWNMLDVENDYYGHIPGVPDYDWDNWDDKDWEAWEAKRKENIEKYLPIIRGWLEAKYPSIDNLKWPKYKSGDVERDLVSCKDLYIPSTTSDSDGMLIIAELSGNDFSNVRAEAITDYGWLIYASAKNLYVVSNSYNWYWDCYDDADSCQNFAHIHRFNLGEADGQARYINSGEVPGYVENQFWMSEYDDHIRVVSTENQWWGSDAGSILSVLKLNGSQMDVVGQVKDIGKGEQLYAARMFGPKGYVVTFERTDPLFTFDLSDPANPKKMAELEINGFSSYIHKMDDNTLLTIGENADDDGRVLGMHLQVFDVTDLSNPQRIQHTMINKTSDNNSGWSEALYDHHAFNYHAASGLLSIPVNLYDWSSDEYKHFTGAYVYKVSREDGFDLLGQVNHIDFHAPSCNDYFWWTSMDRSRFYFKDQGVYDSGAYVYTLSNEGVKVNNALNPAEAVSSVHYNTYDPIVCSDDDTDIDDCDEDGDGEIDPDKPCEKE